MKCKVLLSPCLLELPCDIDENEKYIHFKNISNIIDFIVQYFRNSMEFDFYDKVPYSSYVINPPNYGNGTILANNVNMLFSKIQSMTSPNYIDIQKYQEIEIPPDYILPESDYTVSFLQYISYIICNKNQSVIFLGKDNSKLVPEIEFNSGKILAIADVSEKLQEGLLEYYEIEPNAFFKRKVVCKQLDINNNVVNKLRTQSNSERRATIKKYGDLIARLNYFEYSKKLSTLNSKKQGAERRVYKSKDNNGYLSIDFESGGYEVFDSKCVHQGQYNFNLDKVKDAQPKTHRLYIK